MSFIGSMVSAALVSAGMSATIGAIGGIAATGAVGAGLGAGMSAITGGDVGDGALYGGIGGVLSGGLSGLAGATAGAQAAGYGATSLGSPLAGTAGSLAPNVAAPIAQGASQTATQGGFSGIQGGTSLTGAMPASGNIAGQASSNITPALANTAPVAQSGANNALLAQNIHNAGANVTAGLGKGVSVSELSLGQQAMSHLTNNQSMIKYGGSALHGAVTGAGMQGVGNVLQGKPATENMGISALAGGIGGAGAEGLAGIGGTVGEFAANNKTLTGAGLSLIASPVVSSLVDPSTDAGIPQTQGIKPDFTWNPKAYRRTAVTRGYAAGGGIGDLGSYSDGGQLLKGPGDGVSDSIPASINGKQPARLADGEFVIPARIVSELGNGSTEAGSRRLYDMMKKVEVDRRHTVGHGNIAKNTRAYRHLPA